MSIVGLPLLYVASVHRTERLKGVLIYYLRLAFVFQISAQPEFCAVDNLPMDCFAGLESNGRGQGDRHIDE